jgi:hypothetical protein
MQYPRNLPTQTFTSRRNDRFGVGPSKILDTDPGLLFKYECRGDAESRIRAAQICYQGDETVSGRTAQLVGSSCPACSRPISGAYSLVDNPFRVADPELHLIADMPSVGADRRVPFRDRCGECRVTDRV